MFAHILHSEIIMNPCYEQCNQRYPAMNPGRLFCKKGCDSDEPNLLSSHDSGTPARWKLATSCASNRSRAIRNCSSVASGPFRVSLPRSRRRRTLSRSLHVRLQPQTPGRLITHTPSQPSHFPPPAPQTVLQQFPTRPPRPLALRRADVHAPVVLLRLLSGKRLALSQRSRQGLVGNGSGQGVGTQNVEVLQPRGGWPMGV